MQTHTVSKLPLCLYAMAWKAAVPLLKTHHRIKQGLAFRLSPASLPEADVWIQAASAGEAFLAARILESLIPGKPVRILLTTLTAQGLEILDNAVNENAFHPHITAEAAWFPFDEPSLMEKAVAQVRPSLAVLLETELWPGFLTALKRRKIPCVIINGRLSDKSVAWYMKTPGFWKALFPETILAIALEDARSYSRLFPCSTVRVMPNIKFDTLGRNPAGALPAKKLGHLFAPEVRHALLASVRTEEEPEIAEMIHVLLNALPDLVIGLFPRHMHRIESWETRLARMGVPRCLRSKLKGPPAKGTVIIWDRFGELKNACYHADTVFVGGSLKPLGGQNFMEPATCGAFTVTGPFLDHFTWVGEAFFTEGLAVRVRSWEEAAEAMVLSMKKNLDRTGQTRRTLDYISRHQGGTHMACALITNILNRNRHVQ